MGQLDEKQWYVVYSKPQKEEYAQLHLRSKGLEVFFPKLFLPESARKRRRVIPLFPNYLFVRLRVFSNENHCAIWSPGVTRIISFNGSPASVDEMIVKFLMAQSDHEGIIAARSNLRVGQEVRVCGGPLAGLVGIIRNPPDAKGRVTLLLNLFKRHVEAEARLEHLESGWLT
jgi:transcription elongation factor/antiterminator RfaH